MLGTFGSTIILVSSLGFLAILLISRKGRKYGGAGRLTLAFLAGIALASLWFNVTDLVANQKRALAGLEVSPLPGNPDSPPSATRFAHLNFKLDLDKGPWIESKIDPRNSDACYLARQESSGLTCAITVKTVGLLTSQGALTETIRAKAEASGTPGGFQYLESADFAGITSACAGYTLEVAGQAITTVNLHHVDRGSSRQFTLTTTRNTSLDDLRLAAIELSRGFRLIRPGIPRPIGQRAINPGSFPAWGLAVKAGGSGWTEPRAGDEVRGQIWHGTFRKNSHLLVVPVNLGSFDPDPEALLRGLLSGSTGRTLPKSGVVSRPLDLTGMEASEYEYDEDLDKLGRYSRILRIIRKGRSAFLIDCASGPGEDLAELKKYLDRVVVADPASSTLPENDPAFGPYFFNHAGLSYYARSLYTEARAMFEEAHRLNPTDPDYFNNTLEALSEEGNHEEILKRIESLESRLRQRKSTRQKMAEAFVALGRFEEAREAYARLFESGLRNDDVLEAAIDFLLENDGSAQALRMMDLYQKKGSNQRLERLRARVLTQNNRFQDAADLLEKLRKSSPSSSNILIQLTGVYARLQRHDTSITLLKEALSQDPLNAALLHQLGFQFADCDKYQEAAEVLERGSEAHPKDESIQEELAYVRARLGRGHDREVRVPLDPVPLPPSLVPTGGQAPAIPDPETDRYHLLNLTAYRFEPGTPVSKTIYTDVLLLTERSVEAYSTLRLSFKPLSERIYLNKLEVIDSQGNLVSTGSEKDQYVTDVTGDQATGEKQLCVPVPGLVAGRRLRFSVTLRDRSSSDEFPFDPNFFVARYPTKISAVSVQGTPDSYASVTRGEVTTRTEGDTRIWAIENLPGLPNEGNMPLVELFSPTLYLGPATGDWTKIGDDYLERIGEMLKPAPDIESLARDLVAKAPDEDGKIRAIFRWIQSEFTYKAIEFGSRANIPHPAATTCANRYGDCKDLSILLHVMLRANGIASHPCLVNSSNLIAPELPSLDQFDHMIVHIPGTSAREAFWLDPTDRYHSLVTIPGPDLEGKSTFVLEPGSSRFITIPLIPFPHPHRISIERDLQAAEHGSVKVRETVTFHGQAADGMRSYLASIPAAERLQYVQEWIASVDSSLSLDLFEADGLKDQDIPLVLRLGLKASDHLDADGHLKKIPVDLERDYLALIPKSLRKAPFAQTKAWTVTSRTRGTVKFSGTPEANSGNDPRWGDWQIETGSGPAGWVITFNGRIRRGEIHPGGDYSAAREFWEDGLDSLSRPIAR